MPPTVYPKNPKTVFRAPVYLLIRDTDRSATLRRATACWTVLCAVLLLLCDCVCALTRDTCDVTETRGVLCATGY